MISTINSTRATIAASLETISDAPMLEAELLVEHITGMNRTRQLSQPDIVMSSSQVIALTQLCERRMSGEPLAYILGEAHFWTLKLRVGPAVLIPRPETELVVERALIHLPDNRSAHILDLGTGSGAIALAIAQERPQSQIYACDISIGALDMARDNAARHQLKNLQFCLSEWFNAVPAQAYQVIVSNPPYIALGDPDVHSAVKRHEPGLALFAGQTGLESLNIIVTQAPHYLAPGGWLVLEHGWQQAPAIRELLESVGFTGVASHIDLAGHQRVTEAQWQPSSS